MVHFPHQIKEEIAMPVIVFHGDSFAGCPNFINWLKGVLPPEKAKEVVLVEAHSTVFDLEGKECPYFDIHGSLETKDETIMTIAELCVQHADVEAVFHGGRVYWPCGTEPTSMKIPQK